MPIKLIGDLTVNDVRINEEFAEKSKGVIELRGAGNTLIIDTHRPCRQLAIQLREGSRCEIQQNVRIIVFNLVLHKGSDVIVGQGTIANGKLTLQSHEQGIIHIGRNCLFGSGLSCFTSDMHSIMDVATGDRINPPGDIVVGEQVWAGFDVTLLKGSQIGRGSVIGARSTVTGQFPENSLLAGYPARLVREGVTWSGDLKPLPQAAEDVPLPRLVQA